MSKDSKSFDMKTQPVWSPHRLHHKLMHSPGAKLLLSIVALIFFSPLYEGHSSGPVIESVLITFMLGFAALVVGERRREWMLNLLLLLMAVAGRWFNHVRPDLFPNAAEFAISLAYGIFLIVNILRYVLRAPRVNSEVLCAAISIFLLIGIFWSFSYKLVDSLVPDSFAYSNAHEAGPSMKGFISLYFSFSTLSTLGYGDITPVSNVARMLAFMEALTGMLYISILIARLVSMHSQGQRATDKNSD